jgi:hypothetical protein
MDEIKSGKFLIVEGSDDVAFLNAYLKFLGVGGVEIVGPLRKDEEGEPLQGKRTFKDRLETVLRNKANGNSPLRAYGFVIDADESYPDTFRDVRAWLAELGEPCPDEAGKFVSGPGRICSETHSVGVFVVSKPDGGTGMLEDLFLASLGAEGKTMLPCVKAYCECVQSRAPSDKRNPSKAEALALLAMSPDKRAVRGVGMAAEKGYWDLSSPALNSLKTFLRQLVEA